MLCCNNSADIFSLISFGRIKYSAALRKIYSFLIITRPLFECFEATGSFVVAERNQLASDVAVEAFWSDTPLISLNGV